MKRYEVRAAVEYSDGIWRGSGAPLFVGSEAEATAFKQANPVSFPQAYETQIVTYKKGREVKRQTLGGYK